MHPHKIRAKPQLRQQRRGLRTCDGVFTWPSKVFPNASNRSWFRLHCDNASSYRRAASIHCDATSHSINLQHMRMPNVGKQILRWLAEESIIRALSRPRSVLKNGKSQNEPFSRSLYCITLHVLEEVNHFTPQVRSYLIPSPAAVCSRADSEIDREN